MAINFPSSPATNQIFTAQDKIWKYNGTTWESYTPALAQSIITSGSISGGGASAAAADATVKITGLKTPSNKWIGDYNGIEILDVYGLNRVSLNTSASTRLGSLGIGTNPTGITGEIVAVNQITSYYSDDRLKDRVGNIDNAIEKVLSLNGFYYKANQTAIELGYTDELQVGLSAQEVNNVLPEVVAPAPIDNQYMTIHYERVIPLLVEAIKEQQVQIEELKAKLGN